MYRTEKDSFTLSFLLSSSVGVGKFGIDRRCHTEPPGHRQDLPGGVGRLIGGKVNRRRCHLLGQSHTSQWNVPHKQLSEVVAELFLYRIGSRHAGKNGVAADAVFCLLHSNQPGQIIDGRLAGAVSDLRNVGYLSAYRGNVDDAAAALSCHVLGCRLPGTKNAAQIEGNGVQKHLRIGMGKVQILAGRLRHRRRYRRRHQG